MSESISVSGEHLSRLMLPGPCQLSCLPFQSRQPHKRCSRERQAGEMVQSSHMMSHPHESTKASGKWLGPSSPPSTSHSLAG